MIGQGEQLAIDPTGLESPLAEGFTGPPAAEAETHPDEFRFETAFPWATEWYGPCIDSKRVTKLLEGMSSADQVKAAEILKRCFDTYLLDFISIQLKPHVDGGSEMKLPPSDLASLQAQISNLEDKLTVLFDQAVTAFAQALTEATPTL